MEWFNIHQIHADQLELVLNAHIKKGYRLHHIYRSGKQVVLTLVKDLTEGEWAAKFAAAEARASAAAQEREARTTARNAPPAATKTGADPDKVE